MIRDRVASGEREHEPAPPPEPLTAADRACHVPWSWWRTAHNDIGGPDRD